FDRLAIGAAAGRPVRADPLSDLRDGVVPGQGFVLTRAESAADPEPAASRGGSAADPEPAAAAAESAASPEPAAAAAESAADPEPATAEDGSGEFAWSGPGDTARRPSAASDQAYQATMLVQTGQQAEAAAQDQPTRPRADDPPQPVNATMAVQAPLGVLTSENGP